MCVWGGSALEWKYKAPLPYNSVMPSPSYPPPEPFLFPMPPFSRIQAHHLVSCPLPSPHHPGKTNFSLSQGCYTKISQPIITFLRLDLITTTKLSLRFYKYSSNILEKSEFLAWQDLQLLSSRGKLKRENEGESYNYRESNFSLGGWWI